MHTVVTLGEDPFTTSGQYALFDQDLYDTTHTSVIGRILGVGTILIPGQSAYMTITYAIEECGEIAVAGVTPLDFQSPGRQPIVGALDAYRHLAGKGEINFDAPLEDEDGTLWYDIEASCTHKWWW